MRIQQQFICKKCTVLSNVESFELTRDKMHFVRCQACGAKNRIVNIGATPSQPGLLPVTELLE